jgi:hypothetical protein
MKPVGKISMFFTILLMFASSASAEWITSVTVSPSQPSTTDLITFSISGLAPGSNSWVDHDVFSQNGTSLQLDVYVEVGTFGTGSNWYFDKQIQPLVQGTYNLEVRMFDGTFGSPGYGTVQDTENINFAVTPEPYTLTLLGLGVPFLRFHLKRKD